ncbi:hypothetical protein SAMD00079811_78310 (plasmid) [Scytonema sp. HK-05]|nr:hypothetical protein SAMD00079811_78310 [Scytonema sp. HK-05]
MSVDVDVLPAHIHDWEESPLRGSQKSRIQKSRIEDPTDESRGLNKVAPHFLFSINKFRGLYPFLFRSPLRGSQKSPLRGSQKSRIQKSKL